MNPSAAPSDSVRKALETLLICPTRISQAAAVGARSVGAAYARAHVAELYPVRLWLSCRLRAYSSPGREQMEEGVERLVRGLRTLAVEEATS